MSENTTPAKKTISEEVKRIAAIWKEDLSLAEKNGEKVGQTSEDTFVKTLPEGHTIEQYEQVFTHLENNAAGFGMAVGEWATEQVAQGNGNTKEDRTYLDVSATVFGKNTLNATYTKEKTTVTTNPKKPDEKITTTKFGDLRIGYDFVADRNRGQLKHVKNEINDIAAEAFAKLNK